MAGQPEGFSRRARSIIGDPLNSLSVSARASRKVRWLLSATGVTILLSTWYLVSPDGLGIYSSVILPGPFTTINRLMEVNELVLDNLWSTLSASAFGFVVSVVTGILTGAFFTARERLRQAFMPLVMGGNSFPRVTFAPLFIFYFGGFQASYLLSAWIAYFPVAINAIEGFSALGEDAENLLESIGATTFQEYRKVRFPNALPFLFDGIKFAVPLSVTGALVGEFVGSEKGLGVLAVFALRNLDTPLILGIVLLMGIVSATAFYIVFLLQYRLVFWKETTMFAGEE